MAPCSPLSATPAPLPLFSEWGKCHQGSASVKGPVFGVQTTPHARGQAGEPGACLQVPLMPASVAGSGPDPEVRPAGLCSAHGSASRPSSCWG